MAAATDVSAEDLEDPNVLSQLFPDETMRSVYWRERAMHHKVLVDKKDEASVSCALDEAAKLIREADAVLFVTGAGAGVDMGLPDFRSSNKFWEELNHPGISRYEDSSDSKLFETEPEFVWGLNFHQMSMYRSAAVHDGYKAMLRICRDMKHNNYYCYTTNIDGVLQRAGFDPSRVREVHGCIHRMQCTDSKCTPEGTENHSTNLTSLSLLSGGNKSSSTTKPDAWESDPAAPLTLAYNTTTMMVNTVETPLPLCRNCKTRLARPNVWYCKDSNYVYWSGNKPITEGYQRWMRDLEEQTQRQDTGAGSIRGSGRNDRCRTVVVECGAGLVIPSARVAAEDAADEVRGALIRINPTDYMVPVPAPVPQQEAEQGVGLRASVGIPLGFAAAMREIMQRIDP